MLVTFQSTAAADVVMVDRHAQQVLSLIGKTVAHGSLIGGDLGAAIQVLETAIAESKHHGLSQALTQDAASRREVLGENHFHESHDSVDFARHAFPLLEMMRAAHRGGSDVTWRA